MFPQGFMFLYSGNMETALVSGGASYKKQQIKGKQTESSSIQYSGQRKEIYCRHAQEMLTTDISKQHWFDLFFFFVTLF